jgi:two-component system response regulator YesN
MEGTRTDASLHLQEWVVALEQAEKSMPDIVITDIGMPYMDGLELIRELKRRHGELRVIVLSCMDDFHYAQQAVKLMVNDYILKETISRELITGLLKDISSDLSRQEEEAAQTLRWKSIADNQKTLLRNSVLRRILSSDVPCSEWSGAAEELGIRAEYSESMAVLCRLEWHGDGRPGTDEISAVQLVEDALHPELGIRGAAVFLPHGPRDCVLVLSGVAMPKDAAVCAAMLGKLRSVVQRSGEASTSFQYIRIPAGLEAFRAGISALLTQGAEYAFYLQDGEIHELKDIPSFTGEDLYLHYAEAVQDIREAFLEEAEDRLTALIAVWMDFIREKRFTPRRVKEWTLKLLYDNQMRLMARGQFQSSFSLEILHDTIAGIDHIDRLEEWAVRFFHERLPLVHEMYHQTRREEIKRSSNMWTAILVGKLHSKRLPSSRISTPATLAVCLRKKRG